MNQNKNFRKLKNSFLSILFLGVILTVYFNGLSPVGAPSISNSNYSYRTDDLGLLSSNSMDSVILSLRRQHINEQIDSILDNYRGTFSLARISLIKHSGKFEPCETRTSSVEVYVDSIRYSIGTTNATDFSVSLSDRELVEIDSENKTLNTLKIGFDVKDAWLEVTLRAIVKGCDLKLIDKSLPLRLTGIKVGSKSYFNSEVASLEVKKMLLTDVELQKFDYNLDDFKFLEKVDNLLKYVGVNGAEELIEFANQKIEQALKDQGDFKNPLLDIANNSVLPSIVENFRKEQEYTTDLGSKAQFQLELDSIETKNNTLITKFSSTVDLDGKQVACAANLNNVISSSTGYPSYVAGRPSIGFGLGLIGSLGLLVGKEGLFCVSKSGLTLQPAGDITVSSGSYPYLTKNIIYSVPVAGASSIVSQTLSSATDTSPVMILPVSISYKTSVGLSVSFKADLTINFHIETSGSDSNAKFAIKYMKISNPSSSSPVAAQVLLAVQNVLNTYQEQRITKTYSKLCENNTSPMYEQTKRYERIIETSVINCSTCEKKIGINIKSLDQSIAPGVMDNFIENKYASDSNYTVSFGDKSPYPRVDDVLEECPPQQLTEQAQAELDQTIEENNDRIEDELEIKDRIQP